MVQTLKKDQYKLHNMRSMLCKAVLFESDCSCKKVRRLELFELVNLWHGFNKEDLPYFQVIWLVTSLYTP